MLDPMLGGMRVYASTSAFGQEGLEAFLLSARSRRVDGVHFDCHGDIGVLKQAERVRASSLLDFELHTVGPEQVKLCRAAEESGFNRVLIQGESWPKGESPNSYTDLPIGVAIRPQSLDCFDDLLDTADYVSVMASEPGVGGKPFDSRAIDAASRLKQRFPTKELLVDGGVREALIDPLISAGVNRIVVGSALESALNKFGGMASLSSGSSLLTLKVSLLALPLNQTPVSPAVASLADHLHVLERSRKGFVVLLGSGREVVGFISDGDVRRGLLRILAEHSPAKESVIIQRDPIVIESSSSVQDLANLLGANDYPRLNAVPVVGGSGLLEGHIPREVLDRF